MQFTPRIRSRAATLPHGNTLLKIASQGAIQQNMLQRIRSGEKPVTALSQPLVDAVGMDSARDDNLRRLAGEVAAFIVETEFSCVRSSASRVIPGDPVFTSGQPYRKDSGHPAITSEGTDDEKQIVEVLLAALDDAGLARLEGLLSKERQRRA
ncbi:hypothetical protein [Sinorhizobium sp. CCBAU 05631]|uniref:hypothetical protein n=1 Tax=Sinorhizobium sp. CCBAU 05631 TaxID=794846 RepID=UPI000562A2DC|nr:hypothetical protein [Sinorhizobium sp. CCBAU 05631]